MAHCLRQRKHCLSLHLAELIKLLYYAWFTRDHNLKNCMLCNKKSKMHVVTRYSLQNCALYKHYITGEEDLVHCIWWLNKHLLWGGKRSLTWGILIGQIFLSLTSCKTFLEDSKYIVWKFRYSRVSVSKNQFREVIT